MFGFRFIKFLPTDYVFRFRNGKVEQEGAGLSFFYFSPNTSLVSVPMGAIESPFIFEEVSADFQAITFQGQFTFRIVNPKRIIETLNFTLAPSGKGYASQDPAKLPQRILNTLQVATKKEVQNLTLRQAIISVNDLGARLGEALKEHPDITSLGVQVTTISLLAVKPNTETARALEATAREQILKEADDAIYARRNASVEQERRIKENELSTEIAVENKKRQIREAQMDAERSVLERQQGLEKSRLEFATRQEEEKKKLVALSVANAKEEADAKAYAISASMRAFSGIDASIVQALAGMGMNPQQLIAQAFQGLAEKAEKIGELNISPDLLRQLMAGK